MGAVASKAQLHSLYFRLCSLWHLIVVSKIILRRNIIDTVLVWNE